MGDSHSDLNLAGPLGSPSVPVEASGETGAELPIAHPAPALEPSQILDSSVSSMAIPAAAPLPVAYPAPPPPEATIVPSPLEGGPDWVGPPGPNAPSTPPTSPQSQSVDATAGEAVEGEAAEGESHTASTRRKRSWVFLGLDGIRWLGSRLFGIASLIFLLAASASIPLVQFLSFGYLLEVTGRIARREPISSSMIGLRKASRLGSILLGTWLLLLPIRFVSQLAEEAWLIDPTSAQTAWTQTSLIVLMTLTVLQILAAWVCGGRLRYFFWQLVAPFSFAAWSIRRMANSRRLRPLLDGTIGRISPRLVEDLCRVTPPTDWFVPAIILGKLRRRQLYAGARDGLWNFVNELRSPYYFVFGLKGFVGTFIWLVLPTLLLIGATATDDGRAVIAALFGVLIAVPVFALLPFIQAHYATDGRWIRFFQPWQVMQNAYRAPIAHFVALLLTLVFALPLFLLKIEAIPTELLWTLSLVFVIFIWPTKWVIGWAYRRGTRPGGQGRWWLSFPLMAAAAPVSFAFIFIMFFTRYVTWNGAWSLLENHVFLLPAPFWL